MHWLQTVHSNLSSYTSPHNVDIKFIDIPTTPSPIQPTQHQPSPAATVFRLKDNTAIVHARLTDANTVLELRYLNWTESSDAGKPFSSPRNLRLQIRLSATLLPVIRFSQDSENLWCYVLTTNNYLVRMRLTLENVFLTPLSGKFYSLQQLDRHIVPITFGIVSSTQVIIACENGSLIYLYDSSNGKRDKDPFSSYEIAQQDFTPRQNALSYLNSIPLLSNFFGDIGDTDHQASPQPIALALETVSRNSKSSAIVAAVICRDRRLRVWISGHNYTCSQAIAVLPCFDQDKNLVESGVDIIRDALPGSIVDAPHISPRSQNHEPDLDTEPRNHLRLYRVNDDIILAVVYVQSEQQCCFAIYQIVLEDGDIRSLKLVHVVESNYQPKEWLSGFDMTIEQNDATLWTVWDTQPDSIVRTATIFNVGCEYDPFSESAIPVRVRWRTVLPDSTSSRVAVQRHKHQNEPETFLKNIFAPGAFSDSTIRKALMVYVGTVDPHERTLLQDDFLTDNEDREEHEVTSIGNSSDDDRPTLQKYVRDLVAAHIEKQNDDESYEPNVKREWESFYQLCCSAEDFESIPLGISAPQSAISSDISAPLIITRHDGYAAARTLDELEILQHHFSPLKDDLHQQSFFPSELEHNVFDEDDVQIKKLVNNGKFDSGLVLFADAMASLIDHLGEQAVADIDVWLEQTLLKDNSTPTADAIGHQLYNRFISTATLSDYDKKLTMTKLRECRDLDETVSLVLDALVDTCLDAVSGDKTSAMTDSVVTNATHQLVTTRYNVARNTAVTLAFLLALDGNQTVMKNTVERLEDCHNALKAYTLLKWMCNQPLDRDVEAHFSVETNAARDSLQPFVVSNDHSHTHTSGLMDLLVSRQYPVYMQYGSFEGAVTRAARHLIRQLNVLPASGQFNNASVVDIANCLESFGQPKLALALLQCLPMSDAILFVQAKCWTSLGQTKDAENAFLRVANGFVDDFYEHQPQSSVGQSLQQLLPHGCDTLIEYYIHVSAFVFAHSQADLIIRFSKLALTSIEAVHESTKEKDNGHKQHLGSTSGLWYRVFVAYLLKQDIEGAVTAMSSIEDLERRSDTAKYLVNWLAENNKLGLICSLPLSGLRTQVEEALVSKAKRQQVPVPESQVDFSKNLYAFYVYAGDYGPAALSMYMLAKRCQQNLKAPNALDQSIKSYLAAINSLSLLSQDKQWLSVPLENESKDQSELKDLVTLRKEYVVTKAHSDLMTHYPELANADNIIDVNDAIEKFEKLGLQNRVKLLKL
ncbi:hypothetical protein K450DRAFT_228838 [Umbelopsis ramanniana AG]|uniref:Uncharacterized protein n=1 Tax=Umbelopsis ramanniana AG TaxID=1314678 RepID=A0AAD5HF52_UMBRA|nr:uncharacterized protein K450DRAFT_228838 [Umbelopsis ramanniana AG]KAI8582060.1 hypothetical protein K450DRAFT_228838 [Umbelopsis ramanniana AG]